MTKGVHYLHSTRSVALHSVSPVSLVALHVYTPLSDMRTAAKHRQPNSCYSSCMKTKYGEFHSQEICSIPVVVWIKRESSVFRRRPSLNHVMTGCGSPRGRQRSMASWLMSSVWFCGPSSMMGGGRGSISFTSSRARVSATPTSRQMAATGPSAECLVVSD